MLDAARDLYQDTILDRGRTPRHGRRLEVFDADAREVNPLCGDRCHVFLRRDASARVEAVGFEARGCAISVASADLMADTTAGLDEAGVRELRAAVQTLVRTGAADDAPDALQPLAALHAYPSRIKCAMLPWDALLAALHGPQERTQ